MSAVKGRGYDTFPRELHPDIIYLPSSYVIETAGHGATVVALASLLIKLAWKVLKQAYIRLSGSTLKRITALEALDLCVAKCVSSSSKGRTHPVYDMHYSFDEEGRVSLARCRVLLPQLVRCASGMCCIGSVPSLAIRAVGEWLTSYFLQEGSDIPNVLHS